MKIYLTHPKHGEKIAYCQPEADTDIENGWELKKETVKEKVEEEVEEEVVVPIKRRGRPPKVD